MCILLCARDSSATTCGPKWSYRFKRRQWEVGFNKPANCVKPKALGVEAGELVRDTLANPIASKYLLEDTYRCRTSCYVRWLVAMAASLLSKVSMGRRR